MLEGLDGDDNWIESPRMVVILEGLRPLMRYHDNTQLFGRHSKWSR